MENKKDLLNILINILLLTGIFSTTYAWMITAPSQGELINYDRDYIITSSDVTVDAYAYIDGSYVEQTTSPMNLGLVQPGVLQKFRFDITNANTQKANIKIVFTNITGDIADIQDVILFGSTSPNVFEETLATSLKQSSYDSTYYYNFIDNIEIPASSSLSIYWYATMDEEATNEFMSKNLSIEKIAITAP